MNLFASIVLPGFLAFAVMGQNAELPGERILRMKPEELRKQASDEAMKKWKKPLTDAEFQKLENQSERRYGIETDAEIVSNVPASIAPYARLRDTPRPEIRPWAHWTGHFTQDQLDSYHALISYCPFCDSRALTIRFDPKNPEHAQTTCCKKDLYRKNAPAGYDLAPDSFAVIRYLDDSLRKIPCKLYKDAKGRVWQLFVANLFNKRDWSEYIRTLARLSVLYLRTGNPLYPYKAAVILDRMAESYYALPLSLNNLDPAGKDGLGLSRSEWEALPRPNIWAKMPAIGWWNRNNPTFARGWMVLGREGAAIYEYALLHHHPAFRYYSKKKYGDPAKIDELVRTKLAREINLGYTSVCMNGLIQNYQAANSAHMLASAMIGGDKTLLDFAAANHDCIVYNHHYADGINGEGSVGYQGMLRRQFYPYMLEKTGWRTIDPAFLAKNPFFKTAACESGKQITARGLLFEHGDLYEMIHETPNNRVLGNLDTAEKPEKSNLPSQIWPLWGVGVIRVGAPGERLETILNFSRPSGHGGLMMGLAGWFDGIPALRMHGYAPPWGNTSLKTVKDINDLNFPRKAIYVPKAKPSVHESWNRLLAQSAIGQNTVTVDEVASVKRGLSEPLFFKGGEPADSPASKFQILEVNTLGEFRKMGVNSVEKYRRALIGVETPSGRAYALDIVPLKGGKTQTIWYSVWGDRIGQNGLGEAIGKNNLTEAIFRGKPPVRNRFFSPAILYKWVYGIYDHVTDVETRTEQSLPWAVDYRTDYYAYFRDKSGQEYGRPRPGFGIVNFRIASAPVEPYAVWQAKAPWSPLSANLLTRSGAKIENQTITFDKAFDVLALRRTSKNNQILDSCFVTLLEGRHPGKAPVVSSMKTLAAGSARAVELKLSEGGKDLVFYQETNELRKLAGIETDARFALVRFNKAGRVVRLDMAQGTILRAGGKELRSPAAEDTGTIIEITGDLTGKPEKSELRIRPDKPWNPAAAPGRMLILHQTRKGSFANREGYIVQNAEQMSDGTVKVSLRGPAPFIISYHQAFFVDGKLKVNRPIQKFDGLDYYPGIQVTFPRIGRTFTVRNASIDSMETDTDLQKAGVRNGDWFYFHAITPGQKVSIPRFTAQIFEE